MTTARRAPWLLALVLAAGVACSRDAGGAIVGRVRGPLAGSLVDPW